MENTKKRRRPGTVFCMLMFAAIISLGLGCSSKNGEKQSTDDITRELNVAGNALYDKNQLDAALEKWRECIEIDPKNTGCHMNVAMVYHRQGNLQTAFEYYKKATELSPNRWNTFHNAGQCLATMQNYDEARKYLEKALELEKGQFAPYQLLGTVCIMQGKLDEAAANYEEAIKLSPKYTQLYIEYSTIFERKGELQKAIEALNLAYRPDIRDPFFFRQRASLELQSNEFDAAVKDYREFLKIFPTDFDGHLQLAHAHIMKGTPEAIQKAKDLLAKAKTIDETRDYEIEFKHVLILAVQGNIAEAFDKIEQVIADTPEEEKEIRATEYYQRALLQHEMKKNAEAIQSLEQALREAPTGTISHKIQRLVDSLSTEAKTKEDEQK